MEEAAYNKSEKLQSAKCYHGHIKCLRNSEWLILSSRDSIGLRGST